MFTTKFICEIPQFSENLSEKDDPSFVPGQAYKLSELMKRFESGQRLGVHLNFDPGENLTKNSIYEESFDDAPPEEVNDVVDVHNYYEQHKQEKRDFESRIKQEQEAAQQAAAQAAQQEASL